MGSERIKGEVHAEGGGGWGTAHSPPVSDGRRGGGGCRGKTGIERGDRDKGKKEKNRRRVKRQKDGESSRGTSKNKYRSQERQKGGRDRDLPGGPVAKTLFPNKVAF